MSTKKHIEDLLSSNPRWVKLSDFEALCFDLARELLSFEQPIPDFSTRNPGILESSLETPLQEFGGKKLYPTFERKLAALFYFLTKNHPFQNGNKRIAVTTLFTVLYFNGKWIRVNPLGLYRLAKAVSASHRGEKDKMMGKIERFVKKNIVNF